MIRLDIQEYCAACCDFEPGVTKPEKYAIHADLKEVAVVQTDTIVRCKYAKRCECIRRYLKQQIGENKESEKSD